MAEYLCSQMRWCINASTNTGISSIGKHLTNIHGGIDTSSLNSYFALRWTLIYRKTIINSVITLNTHLKVELVNFMKVLHLESLLKEAEITRKWTTRTLPINQIYRNYFFLSYSNFLTLITYLLRICFLMNTNKAFLREIGRASCRERV